MLTERRTGLPTGAELVEAFKQTGLVPDEMLYATEDQGQRCACALGVLAVLQRGWEWASATNAEQVDWDELVAPVADRLGVSMADLDEFERGVLSWDSPYLGTVAYLAGAAAWREVLAAVERGELPRRNL